MTAKYTLYPAARRDLDEIADYIARDNIDAALRFYDAAHAAFEQLATMPGMGPLREYRERAFADVRSWPLTRFENYLVFYRPVEGGIEVLRVLHGARDVDRIVRQS